VEESEVQMGDCSKQSNIYNVLLLGQYIYLLTVLIIYLMHVNQSAVMYVLTYLLLCKHFRKVFICCYVHVCLYVCLCMDTFSIELDRYIGNTHHRGRL